MLRAFPSRRGIIACAVLGLGLAACEGLTGSITGASAATQDLSGTWVVTRTLLAAPSANPRQPLPSEHPPGFQTQEVWTIRQLSPTTATLSTAAGTVQGSLQGGLWVFTFQTSPGPGVLVDSRIEAFAAPPLRGTILHRFLSTSTGYEIGREASVFEGVRR